MKMNLITNPDAASPQMRFDGVIGQDGVMTQLKFLLASHDPSTPFPTLLFSGSHGLGKTFLAEKVAKSLSRRFITVNCEMIATEKDFFEKVLIDQVIGEIPITILFDESHRMSTDLETVLLTLLAPNKENGNVISFRGYDLYWDMSRINVIFATTDAYKMFKPLVNRSKVVHFDHYGENDLYDIIQLYAPELQIDCDKSELALAARGRARTAFDLAQDLKRMAKTTGDSHICEMDWEELKKIFGINPLGLKDVEVTLLKNISTYGPISARNLAVRMMLNEENIKEEIEIRPRELGLITNTNRGRMLTDEGLQYISDLRGR